MLRFSAFLLCLFLAGPALAAGMTAKAAGPATLAKGVAGDYKLTITDAAGKPVTDIDIDEVHQSKVHLLVVDESMTDYQHIHPKADGDGFAFSFTPKTGHDYMAWADVTLKNGDESYLPMALKGTEACAKPCVDLMTRLKGEADGLKGEISFDKPVKAGDATMMSLKVTDEKGKPVDDLETVMDAMAHVVGFYTTKKGVVHLHPLGIDEDLDFHLEPEAAGPLKLFAQVRRAGKDIFIPFTVMVK